jgi:tRNA-Thr(GGU) m(6)t(6)A37 methyltransferase TsaA
MTDTAPGVFQFQAIGRIHSPYPEKFAVPRQPGLVTAAQAQLQLLGDCNREEILRGIEGFSHLWLTFVFHEVSGQGWKPTVRPPRLGGNQRVGGFATRSPFRPNPIGLSVVTLEGIEKRGKHWTLLLGGADLVDGTPVLDIKPYVAYADAIASARSGFADTAPATLPVSFSAAAQQQVLALAPRYPNLQTLIEQVIAQQPQPAYQRGAGATAKTYGMSLYDLNIRWDSASDALTVLSVERIPR